ncbi:unnamed protein product, partial [marine sediment metagenome]
MKKFKGFTKPTYTQTPNEAFDILLDMLNGSELKVLLYIIRRTFGFKKESDNISLNQVVNGIKKKDGSIQDYGTGISKLSARKAVKRLIEKNVILKIRRKDESGKDKSPNYSLNEEEKTYKNLLYLNIDKKIAKSLIKKHGFKKINTYIKYLNYKLDKGFKPKDSIAAFLVDSIVNSYIL